jgi:hypothetical protein
VLAGVECSQKGISVLLEAFVGWVVQLSAVCGESGADVSPVGPLREIDHVINMFVLPAILDPRGLILRFHRLDLKPVAFRTVRSNEVDRVGGIQQRGEDLPAVLHQPSGNQKLVRMVLVQPGVCVCQTSSPFGHAWRLSREWTCGVNADCEQGPPEDEARSEQLNK